MSHEKTNCQLTVWLVQGGDAPAFVFARSAIAAIRAYREEFPEADTVSIEPWLKLKESSKE